MSSVGEPTIEQTPVAEQLGPYRLIRRLGQGGMGVVHLGTGPDGKEVAVKVLRPHVAHDKTARARLEREVATLQRVSHPGVAGVLDHDLHGERPYLVTRYVPGPQLDEQVEERGPLTPRKLLMTAGCLAESLQAIHAVGVVHRDLKPGNVLMCDGKPVIIDFGIAQAADDLRLTATGLVIGTPGYLAPELVSGGPVAASTDWWGWAATVAFAATGRRPFGRGPFEIVLHRVQTGQADLEGIDPRLAPLLAASLSPDRAERPTADEILTGLGRYAEGRDALVRADRTPTRPNPTSAATAVLPAATDPDAGTIVHPDSVKTLFTGGSPNAATAAFGAAVAGAGASGSAGLAADAVTAFSADGTKIMPEVLPEAGPTPEEVAALVPSLIPKRTPKPKQQPGELHPFYQPPVRQTPAYDPAAYQNGVYPAAQPGGYPPAVYQPGTYPGAQQPGTYAAQQPAYAPQQSAYAPQHTGAYTPQQTGGHPAQQPAAGQAPAAQAQQGGKAPAQQAGQATGGRPGTRSGTLAAVLLALSAFAALYPVLAVIVVSALIVIARLVDRTQTAMMRRRQTRGGRGRSDGVVATLASPVHLATSVLITLPCLIPPLLMGMVTGGIVAVGLAATNGLEWQPLVAGSVGAGALVGLMSAWWGPGGSSLRRGSHAIARTTLRPAWLRTIVVAALLLVALFLAWLAITGTDTVWAPLTDPFDSSQLPDKPKIPDLPGIDIPFIN